MEQLDIEIGQDKVMERFAKSYLNQAHEFKSRKYDNETGGKEVIDLYIKAQHGWFPTEPLTVTELDRTLEFFLTYNILSMQQVQEIRTKAAAYLR